MEKGQIMMHIGDFHKEPVSKLDISDIFQLYLRKQRSGWLHTDQRSNVQRSSLQMPRWVRLKSPVISTKKILVYMFVDFIGNMQVIYWDNSKHGIGKRLPQYASMQTNNIQNLFVVFTWIVPAHRGPD